jgi:sRNA-binding carbon storage regulator CsrA
MPGLTITRREGERVLIELDGRKVWITADRKCRLNIEAPSDVEIVRGELVERER